MREIQNVYKIFVGKPEGKRPLGRPRHGGDDSSGMDLGNYGSKGMDWIRLAYDCDQSRDVVN
jgi:hypothetical protein